MTAAAEASTRELLWLLRHARSRRPRPIRDFAESEVILPEGPYEGRPFDARRQPYAGLWLGEIDSGRWRRHVATGPVQSGKTLCCFLLPLLYHLFELQETVIVGVPSRDHVADKWTEEILPVIEQSRYRELLPRRGPGSRGGTPQRVRFGHGPTLRFLTGGGQDKARAGFTSRVLVVSETDGMDEPGAGSREADKVTQLEARTRAFGDRARVYMECTVSTEQGRTWREYQAGTESRIAMPCPRCARYVTLERSDLVGWEAAEHVVEARARARWSCPSCAATWSEAERRAAAIRSVLVHRGQDVDDRGRVTGEPPATETLGFRWSAPDNLLTTAAEVGGDEWAARRDTDDRDNAEKELRQFVWAVPWRPETVELSELQVDQLIRRTVQSPRGVAPGGTTRITVGCDVGKYLCHWIAIAWRQGASGTIIDYGRLEVPCRELGVERGLLTALREWRDTVCEAGWQSGDRRMVPDYVVVDAGWLPDPVHRFAEESGERYLAAKGHGTSQSPSPYSRPSTVGRSVLRIGEDYHLARLQADRGRAPRTLLEIDADAWKSWLHRRPETTAGQPGAVTLHDAPAHEHLALAHHLTAERPQEEFQPRRGRVVRWVRVRRSNHWLDAAYPACAAAHLAGVRLLGGEPAEAPAEPSQWFAGRKSGRRRGARR